MAPTRIMIVDDEPHIRNILKINLACSGYDVVEFTSAAEAIPAVGEVNPALIISDHEMPGNATGLDLMRHVRALPASGSLDPLLPFILLTGSTSLHMQLKPELHSIPNLELQSKPFSVRNLLKIVKSMLDPTAAAA